MNHQPTNPEPVKLTSLSHGMGCGCKMRPQYLEKLLAKLPVPLDQNLLVGTGSSDDAAVYKISEDIAIVQTVDFFTPIVDDPYDFGAIAAANAISDVYAMGGKPLFALNVVAFPTSKLPGEVLELILKGASDMAAEAGICIAGGHSIDDEEPKFGMTVTGVVNPHKIMTNNTALPGDCLILTKPLGTGIITTGIRKGIANDSSAKEAIRWMKTLNKTASETMADFNVHACTDVTGFGLAGHLSEMTKGSLVNAEIYFNQIPFMSRVSEYANAGAIAGGTRGNLQYYSQWLDWDDDLSEIQRLMVCDAQTSGGLLISVHEDEAFTLIETLHKNGVGSAAIIGRLPEKGSGRIKVLSLDKNHRFNNQE